MWKHVAANGITLLIVALVAVAGLIGWGVNQYRDAGPLAQAICLRVAPGSTMSAVSSDLESQNAVSNARLFRMGADYTDKSGALKAGSFLVPEQASMEEIVDIVTQGGQSTCGTEIVYRIGVRGQEVQVRELDPATNRFSERAAFDPATEDAPDVYAEMRDRSDTRYRIAVAEGVTSWQIVEALKAADFMEGTVDGVPGEGRLAPDSYEVSIGDTRENLLSRMEARQDERLANAWEDRASNLPYDTPEEALIMASIVEKETGLADERPQVAAVFVNRLEQGMRLQTDPTVIYGITNGEGVLGRGLRRSELDATTPYNTYQIDGLPPTPIANPGLDAIEAALNPDSHDYIFFVADGTGGHAFAETLAEHNENVARWRQIEAEAAADAEAEAEAGQ
ncbi:putative aminodeoxychorismate lyase [Rhodobacteraceae bacterium THAF1]|uniref:endolytic transglycosylase MltG n=1 Tax=Palleronia sp. THAF1 TaxID=2587842 RepID=UPI000F3B2BEF|nr:endolytic transglycosylase MltG [Palleronia sp. THAF1]QFU08254.1 putative aminodeoxychorismate lyase [Palleronia sp. THAF1]VDC28817.1 putative aminodeoxychorismate lyase [Rhodobacteraceae bacterium THAF1]